MGSASARGDRGKPFRRRLAAFLHSLRFKLLLSHTALAIAPLVLASLVFYLFLIDEVQRKVSDSTLDKLSAASGIIDQKIRHITSFVDGFMSDEDVNKILSREFSGYIYRDVSIVSAALAKSSDSGQLIRSMTLATKTGHLYRNGTYSNLDMDSIMRAVLYPPSRDLASRNSASHSNIRWLGVGKSSSMMLPGEPVLRLAGIIRKFTDFSDLGILYLELSSKELYDFVSLAGNGGKIFLADGNGLILAASEASYGTKNMEELGFDMSRLSGGSGYFRMKIEGETMLVSCFNSSLTGWSVIEYRTMASLLPETTYFTDFFLLFVAFLTVFVAVLSLLISSRISRPVVRLSELMLCVEEGDLDVSIEVEGKDEIRRLSESFNSMVSQLRELIARIYEQEKAKKKAEFEALQAQINPHFLYNTLGNIQWMAIIHKLPSIADMTSSLIRLLKLSLASPNPMIELEKEIDMLVQYVHILNVRYNNSIEFVHRADGGLESALVPRLILQPLVENAIIHGLDNSRERGRIELDCFREGEDLVLRLRDSGSGISGEKIAGLLEAEAAGGGRRGIGLRNVNDRIKLYYGETYGLAVASPPGGGTTITLRMPVRMSSGES